MSGPEVAPVRKPCRGPYTDCLAESMHVPARQIEGGSELRLEPQLNLSWRQLVLHDSERWIVDNSSDQVVIGMVRQVKDLHAELQLQLFADAEGACNGGIDVTKSRSDHGIATHRTELVNRLHEGPGVEPFSSGTLCRRQVRIHRRSTRGQHVIRPGQDSPAAAADVDRVALVVECKGEAALQLQDAGELPAAQYRPAQALGEPMVSLAERQFVNTRGDKAKLGVEVCQAALRRQIERVLRRRIFAARDEIGRA